MPSKEYVLDDDLLVTIYKRSSSRNIRLSITPAGKVRVSIPTWAPYKAGLEFAKSKQGWIALQTKTRQPLLLSNGQAIGKAHHLVFMQLAGKTSVTSRILASSIIVRCPIGTDTADPEVQRVAEIACIRALRQQAEQLLPQRLADLAEKFGFEYRSVSVKRLTGRWGSCDQDQHIVLNLYLMQLPWDLIDYVLLHELTHTRILRHGAEFWEAMGEVLPSVMTARKRIRDYQPILASRTD